MDNGSINSQLQICFSNYWNNYRVIKGLILIICSFLFVSSGMGASLSIDADNDDIFSSDEILMPLEADKSPDFLDEFNFLHNVSSEIANVIRQGLNYLRKNERKQGLELLRKAWEMDTSLPAAGVAIAAVQLKAKKYDAALEVAKRLQKNSPDISEGYTLAGIAYAALGDQKQMQLAFEKALDIRPGDTQAGRNLAKLKLAQGKTDRARSILKDVLIHNPYHLKTTLSLAEIELNSGHQQEALSILETATVKHPSELQPHLLLAQVYLMRNMAPQAHAVLQSAMEQFPDQSELLELVGVTHMKNGKPAEAILALKAAVKLKPNSLSIHYNLALAYEKLKQFDQALQEIDSALKLDPTHMRSQYLHAKLMANKGRYDRALKLLQKLESPFREYSKVKELEGMIALAQNQPAKAILLFQDALKNQENNYLIIQLAVSQFKAGETKAGYTTLRNWLSKYPEDLLARATLADVFIAQGKYDEAQKHYLEIVKKNSNHMGARNNLAWLFAKTGDFDKALLHAKFAYEKSPDNPQIMDTLGEIFLLKGQPEKALELLQKAADKLPESLSIHFHLAQALVAVNKKAQAKKILNKLLAQNKPFKAQQLAQKLLNELESN